MTSPSQTFRARILVVDDDSVNREMLQEVLTREGFWVEIAESGEKALKSLRESSQTSFALVLSDIRMMELDGLALLKEIKKSKPHTVVILMTGFGSMAGAVEAIREGAFDYISKPFQMGDLKSLVGRAIKHWESTQSVHFRGAREVGSGKAKGSEDHSKVLIGKSPKIVEVYKAVARASLSASCVLLHGESGTGKELVARSIHEHGPRQKKKFVTVNCGAQSEASLEHSLFGKQGLLEEANGGTLYLDEVGDLSMSLQIRLLRFLEEGSYRQHESNLMCKSDVRVIAATHEDLEKLIKGGKFREDLYFRLKVILIELPALRERIDDLYELVDFFVSRFSLKNKKSVSHISDEAFNGLKAYAWPGNIRELEHAIERAVALTNTPILYVDDFPKEIFTAPPVGQINSESALEGETVNSLESVEKDHILRILKEVGYNKTKASERLGIDRATLYRKASRYGIDLKRQS